MKLINSRGRVLLEVVSAHGTDATGIVYVYHGDGCGGCATITSLHCTIEAIKRDNPSAHLVGMLPEPSPLPEAN